jgi:hypothetical protein
MQSDFNNRDFEQFVRQNADQYRMFPSEKVWRGIHSSLHTRRRWYGIGLGLLLLLTTGTVTWVMLNPSSGSKQLITSVPSGLSADNKNITDPGPDNTTKELVRKPAKKTILFTTVSENENLLPLEITTQTSTNDIAVNADNSVSETNLITVFNQLPVNNREANHITAPDKPTSITVFAGTVIDDNPEMFEGQVKKTSTVIAGKRIDHLPLTIESVVNSFKTTRSKKLSYQLYVTPTISYRKLRENKAYINSDSYQRTVAAAAAPYNYLASITDVNNVVTHKPDVGFELGLSAGYQATRDIKIKGGIQFNVSRYDIKAFTYNGEVATLALSNGNDMRSVSTNLRNSNGYASDWLQNLYFSVSLPVGFEYRLGESGKTSVNIGGTIQPSYILSERAYLISSDYKNYAQASWLTRRVNLTTSLETFINFKADKLQWQVGPQVRYQMLSSFKQQYPVRENIFDFGIKVGVMFNR